MGNMSVKILKFFSHYSPMGYSAGDVVSTGTVSGVAAFSGDPKPGISGRGCNGMLKSRILESCAIASFSWQEAYDVSPPPWPRRKIFVETSMSSDQDNGKSGSAKSTPGPKTVQLPLHPGWLEPVRFYFLKCGSTVSPNNWPAPCDRPPRSRA